MKFSMPAADLARILGVVNGVVPARATFKLLECVLLEAADGIVSVRGSCMDMEATAGAPATVEIGGVVAIHAATLYGLMRRFSKTAVATIEVEDDRAKIKCERASFVIQTLSAEDFPVMDPIEGSSYQIDAAEFKALLDATIGSTAQADGNKWYLGGIYLHIKGQMLAAVATDDHRMAYRQTPAPEAALAAPGVTIPAAAAAQIIALLDRATGPIEIAVTETRITVRAAGGEITSMLLAGAYPPYERVIPKTNGAAASVHSSELLEVVERAMVVFTNSTEKSPAVGLEPTAEGLKVLAGGRGGAGDAVEFVASEINVGSAEIPLNAKYLTEMLKLWPDMPLDIQRSDAPGAPVLFTSPKLENQMTILMPRKR